MKNFVIGTIYNLRSLDTINHFAFLTASYILNNIQTAYKKGLFLIFYQLLSTSNSNANFLEIDIDFFKEIPINNTTLWQIVIEIIAIMTLKNIDLIKNDHDIYFSQAAIIRLNNKSIFMSSIDNNVNTLLQTQEL